MSFFNPLEGSVLLRSKGSFTEAKIFERNGQIYAKRGNAYIRLMTHERTSVDKLFWSEIKGTPYREHTGFIEVSFPQLTSAA
jgi:hypothetical protein